MKEVLNSHVMKTDIMKIFGIGFFLRRCENFFLKRLGFLKNDNAYFQTGYQWEVRQLFCLPV